ncbi:30S ribosomal protein S8 [Candidatus Babeliales bacterium]|nr:30S ribosomal protein S8 [Candidatus Babeliales bacterium]
MSIDAIGDFLTIIRNGVMVGKPWVKMGHSRMREGIANLLKDEGFLSDVYVIEEDANKKSLKLTLKYVDGESAIHSITRKSTPGLRRYSCARTIEPVIGGLGITILSTNRGIMTQHQAKTLNVGGEVLCTVW